MTSGIVIARGWWCWLEVPVLSPGFGASPIFVERVTPLKSGKGLLSLAFIHAIHPIAARRRKITIQVLTRYERHLVGTAKDDTGITRTIILTPPDYGWLETFCPIFSRRRRPHSTSLLIEGEPLCSGPKVVEYLDASFGREPADILRGAYIGSFGGDHPPMPPRFSTLSVARTFDAFDSWMIGRGLVPQAMEEKWFIYLESGRLLFRRSWTGYLIYDVEATWRGDQLYLGQAKVNRNPDQYAETDDENDRQLLIQLIESVLLGGEEAD